MTLRCVPLQLVQANQVVSMWHRHHKPCVGHRFSIGAVDDSGRVCGVLIAGRPVARMVDHTMVIEVSRVATDGTRNACSFLLGSAARVARCMGFAKIQTYTLDSEGGSSLKGAGWTCEALTNGGQWIHTSGPRRKDQPTCQKLRWVRDLNDPVEFWIDEPEQAQTNQIHLWGEM